MLRASLANKQRNEGFLIVTWTGSLQRVSHGQKSHASMLPDLKLSSKIIITSNQSIILLVIILSSVSGQG